ncbi:multifunctional CCA tRNA nucleotidyl transferase/2'3'-cyclic phosphodiesterase/2'nucleotidase/phosphatase [Aliidiomarina soli]|uniref:Multifunctional CCA tRNA nucleotidyl transferase/2'3'-cyclic phosphodiesterase/2'nucleotidase/phosphatase n=1 Tax=Aliidiomarina soli TaxID=1928574 RepID=A0A432WH03_9GAMM|nr:multifunctional CCA tRNA nucleotidyl transferase/2'3'-cyclic phosphodiesterase/2'nucleotidase/phosphatase [Aliidiomarina soli]RUO32969.1 multifunctional CCA tRNA nucleotidyl transferase/2'3'-cyclic phosphodiesterase/2'nucleotidase/phosphatase [Aliidiomarina soli]
MKTYLVGGAVRDELLGLDVHERDYVVVGATPDEMVAQGFTQVGKDFPVFLHPESREEYALARTERKSGKGYTGFDCYAAPDVTLEDDLQRRDLTINAIAKAADGTLIDPYQGQLDIQRRSLRHVSAAFSEDPLRILRLARFAARFEPLGFSVADETWQLMQSMVAAEELGHLAKERIWQELSRSLLGPSPDVFCRILDELNAWPQLLGVNHWQPVSWSSLEVLRHSLQSEADYRLNIAYTIFAQAILSEGVISDDRELAATLRVPNECAELSALVTLLKQELEPTRLNADCANAVTKVIQRADPIRRPERWQDLLTTLDLLDWGSADVRQRLSQAAVAYQTVNPQTLMELGLQGAALGQALKDKRHEAVCRALQ